MPDMFELVVFSGTEKGVVEPSLEASPSKRWSNPSLAGCARESVDEGEDEEALSSTRMEGGKNGYEAADAGYWTVDTSTSQFPRALHRQIRTAAVLLSESFSLIAFPPYAMLVREDHLLTTFSTISPCCAMSA